MLRRLTVGFFVLACAGAIAACGGSYGASTPYSGGVAGIGPNFVTNTIYVTNTTQNSVAIYTPSPAPAATPQYTISGNNTDLNGPLYAAFDSKRELYVTNYNAGTQFAALSVYAQFATGNVLPVDNVNGNGLVQPHGVTVLPTTDTIVVANTSTTGTITSSLIVLNAFKSGTSATQQQVIAGDLTGLNYPIGIAHDSTSKVFVANRDGASITAYAIPSPTPASTSTPSPTPSPSPSASPAPTPTPYTTNIAPSITIAGAATGLIAPTGIALDGSNNIYVVDPDNGAPSIRIFASGSNGNVAPMRVITGSLTLLSNPVDIKVDSGGTVYVVDSGANKLLIFAPTASGNVAPSVAITLPQGSGGGLVLSP